MDLTPIDVTNRQARTCQQLLQLGLLLAGAGLGGDGRRGGRRRHRNIAPQQRCRERQRRRSRAEPLLRRSCIPARRKESLRTIDIELQAPAVRFGPPAARPTASAPPLPRQTAAAAQMHPCAQRREVENDWC